LGIDQGKSASQTDVLTTEPCYQQQLLDNRVGLCWVTGELPWNADAAIEMHLAAQERPVPEKL